MSDPDQLTKQWVDLTTAETKVLWNMTRNPRDFAKVLIAKFKEKNEQATRHDKETP